MGFNSAFKGLNVTFYRPSLKIQTGAILGSLILNTLSIVCRADDILPDARHKAAQESREICLNNAWSLPFFFFSDAY